MDTDLEKIFELLERKNLPFCFYSLPDTKVVNIVVNTESKKDIKSDGILTEKSGFIYRSFDKTEKPSFIAASYAGDKEGLDWEKFEALPDDFSQVEKENSFNNDLAKEDYLIKIAEVVQRIKNGWIDKLVFSRSKKLENKKSAVELFEAIRQDNSNAFNYLLRTNNGQIWFGASPEILLAKSEDRYKTMALAGTVRKEEVSDLFSEKNKEEQLFVTDFIRNKLTDLSATNIDISEPVAITASNVSHIKSAISFDLPKDQLEDIVSCAEGLHPTPAVAGTPQDSAIRNILEVENYNRGLYAGYLGPINILDVTATFVNIRCAQYFKNHVELYVGGGITKDSDPEMEWEETENKAALITNAVMCNSL